LEVTQKAKFLVRSPKVIQALREMFVTQPIDAFQLDDDGVLNQNVGEVFSHVTAFISNRKRGLRNRVNPPAA